jgi:hypothetical protein
MPDKFSRRGVGQGAPGTAFAGERDSAKAKMGTEKPAGVRFSQVARKVLPTEKVQRPYLKPANEQIPTAASKPKRTPAMRASVAARKLQRGGKTMDESPDQTAVQSASGKTPPGSSASPEMISAMMIQLGSLLHASTAPDFVKKAGDDFIASLKQWRDEKMSGKAEQ